MFSKQDCELPFLFEVQKKREQGICGDLFSEVSVVIIQVQGISASGLKG